MTNIECAVSEDVVLEVGVIVDCGLIVALIGQELPHERSGLFKISLTIGGRVVCAWKSCNEFVGVRVMVGPRTWPACSGGEIIRVRVPVEA